jgi:predicted nuclease of predicted toxin-antitoxin system
VKLLLDQNLSPQPARALTTVYPGSGHVKVVWIRLGNCSTREIEEILRAHHADLLAFEQDEYGAFLALG